MPCEPALVPKPKKSRPRPVLANAAPPKGRCEAEGSLLCVAGPETLMSSSQRIKEHFGPFRVGFCRSVASANGAYPTSVNPGWEGQKRAITGLYSMPAAHGLRCRWSSKPRKLGGSQSATNEHP